MACSRVGAERFRNGALGVGRKFFRAYLEPTKTKPAQAGTNKEKIMKKLATLVAALTFATAFSVAYGAGLPVEASWGTSLSQNGITFDMTMKLENQQMTTTNVCTFQGQSVIAAVTVPASYDGTSITVLASAERQVSQNGVNCNVSVRPDRMNYVISGNSLILTHEGSPDQFVLTRR